MTIIDKLRELEAKATPGPWGIHAMGANDEPRAIENDDGSFFTACSRRIGVGKKLIAEVMLMTCEGGGYPRIETMEELLATTRMIAAMRNALPALLRVAEAAKAVMNECEIISSEHSHEDVDRLLSALSALEVDNG